MSSVNYQIKHTTYSIDHLVHFLFVSTQNDSKVFPRPPLHAFHLGEKVVIG